MKKISSISILSSKSRKGFTLIELLLVISIIGILAATGFANFHAARQRGRDSQRKSDLRQIQTGLRLYYNDRSSYPTHNTASFTINGCGTAGTSTCDWGVAWTAGSQTYMTVLPADPVGSSRVYRYERSDADNYTLKACLENQNDSKCSSGSESWCTGGCVYEVKP